MLVGGRYYNSCWSQRHFLAYYDVSYTIRVYSEVNCTFVNDILINSSNFFEGNTVSRRIKITVVIQG
jgi:hypothetical protein